MKLNDLLSPWVSLEVALEVFGLQNDSRQIMKGDVFLAYPGDATDGRNYIEQALKKGASAVIYDSVNCKAPLSQEIPCIPIPNLATQLSKIASRFYNSPTKTLGVVGVTGTNGKTTIAYQLAQAYSLLGQRAAYIGTIGEGEVSNLNALNNTTPDALCLQRLCHEYLQMGIQKVCMEVSSHALHQGRVEDILFDIGLFTNLTQDHLDYHHTFEAYAKAKARLFQHAELAYAIINHDDAYGQRMLDVCPPSCQKLTYGMNEGSEIRGLNFQQSLLGSQFEVSSPWGKEALCVNLVGQFNIYNSLAIYGCLLASGMQQNEVVRVMAELKAAPGRLEVVSKTPCVIVDYAHTPDALENVLSTLTSLKQGRLGVVFGCGGDRDKTKRPMMGKIAERYADFVIVTSDNPRHEDPQVIVDEICSGLSSEQSVQKIVDRKEAIIQGLNMTGPNDILLIAGKGHESYQQIGDEKFAFSDREVVNPTFLLKF